MRDKKQLMEAIKKVRANWGINPKTRVQENQLRNKKKRRQEKKKWIKEGLDQ